jgi:hypothetical protein
LFEGDSMPGVMFVLLERLPDGGSGAQLVTEEESRQFLSCRP